MRCDLPECKRCFACIPLRYGIIIFGYLNLLFGLFVLTAESAWMIRRGNGTLTLTESTVTPYKGVSVYVQTWLILLLYVVEIVFNIILLVGAHMRQIKLIRIYYYYGITTLLATFATFLVVNLQYYVKFSFNDAIELSVVCIGMVSQAYLLLLIRTEMMKRRYQKGTSSYVNHMSNITYPPNWRDTDVL